MHLREPLYHPPIDIQWLRDLHLIFHTFEILIQSPYFIMSDGSIVSDALPGFPGFPTVNSLQIRPNPRASSC
jgi:hypothetical protein